jgi:hypothetical protein
MAVYFFTLAPDLTWANYSSDGGELITAAVTLGVPHPPGYPTYTILGNLFSKLPVGTIAFRFNLFSAVAMSIAAAFTTLTALVVTPAQKSQPSVALATGLAFAFSPLVWGQATVSEVYALNLAVLSIFLWSLLAQRSTLLTGISLGLALTTHLTSLFMLPMGFALSPPGKRGRVSLGLFLGLLPILTLPLLASLGSPVIWGDLSSLAGFWWLISAQIYTANFGRIALDPHSLLAVSAWSAAILKQFAWLGWVFVIIGVFANQLDKRLSRWLLISAAVYAVFSLLYKPDDAILIFLPALMLLAPFLANGLQHIGRWSLLFPILLLAINFQAQDLRHETQVRAITEDILTSVPGNAIVMTPGDQSIFSLWYFHHVEGIRPDIILVDENLMAFPWYRRHLEIRYPGLQGLSVDDLRQFKQLNLEGQPICELTLLRPQEIDCLPAGARLSTPNE